VTRYPGFQQYMEPERGFRGWLVFFYVTSCVGAALRAYWLFQAGATLRLVIGTGSASLIGVVAVRTLVHAGMLIATIYGLLLFAKADRRTPTFWGALLVASIASFIVLDALVSLQTTAVDAPFATAFWPVLRAGLPAIALQLAWMVYWIRSVRVRLTFGSTAFIGRAASPASSISPVT